MSPTGRVASARSLTIDAWRCAAITLVLLHHCVLPAEAAGALRGVVVPLTRFGWTGVDLFFVLSGFLIGRILFAELAETDRLRVGRFLIRRAFKIWPGYFVYLTYVLLFVAFVRPRTGLGAAAAALVPNFVHLQNYLGSVRPHTWSLAVEEHFYLALPILLLLIHRALPRRRTWIALAGSIAVIGAYRIFGVLTGRIAESYFATHLRMDSLLFGVLLGHLAVTHPATLAPSPRARVLLALLGVAALAPMLWFDKSSVFVQSIGFSLLFLGYGACFVATLGTASPASTTLRIAARLGGYSYATYLWFEDLGRTPVGALLTRGLGRGVPAELRWLTAELAYVTLAMLVGATMTVLVERPLLRLRDRLLTPADGTSVPRSPAAS